MHPIVECMEKDSRLVVGLMSGTSADGVDAALCRITGHGTASKIEQLGFVFQPFSGEIRREILRLASGNSACAADFCKMNFLLGELYVQAVEALCAETGIRAEQIDLIGSHGQTFWHIPLPETYLGHSFRSTFQLGEGSVLAQRFGCPVVSDFRVRDVAADGLGAPLVPYSEFLIYRSETECVALQNIGGIGNITCLLPACRLEDVFAFDTGPGNMVMDAVYTELSGGEKTFDEGGAYAAGGKVHEKLLEMLMQDAYLSRKPPKTTGREYYGPDFVKKIMDYARRENISGQDLMATVTDYTAQTIRYSVEHYFPRKPDKLIIGGGGAGSSAAIEAHEAGANVMMVTKLRIGDANTMMAEGGIQAADKENDSPQQHYLDAFGGGHFAARPELLRRLVMEAPDAIQWLNDLGVMFDKDKDGRMITTHGGGTSRKRMHACKDYSGAEIMRVLRDEVWNRQIPVVDFTAAVELIKDDKGQVAGAVLQNMETGEYKVARAKTVIIATGGAGRLHYQHFPTSNHYGATADGLVMGYRAGAPLLYQDTIQYHPTGAAYPAQIFGALVTEKVRSVGAMLINVDGASALIRRKRYPSISRHSTGCTEIPRPSYTVPPVRGQRSR